MRTSVSEVHFNSGDKINDNCGISAAPRKPSICPRRPGARRARHVITYLRLLDADAVGADWREVARIVLHLDQEQESGRARRTFVSHLACAKWMTEHGYRHLLRGDASA